MATTTPKPEGTNAVSLVSSTSPSSPASPSSSPSFSIATSIANPRKHSLAEQHVREMVFLLVTLGLLACVSMAAGLLMLWRWRTSKCGRRPSWEKTADEATETTALKKGKGKDKGKGVKRVVPEVRISQVDGGDSAVFGSGWGGWGGFDVEIEFGDPSEWYHGGSPIASGGEGESVGGNEERRTGSTQVPFPQIAA